jgi:hypothetical protein
MSGIMEDGGAAMSCSFTTDHSRIGDLNLKIDIRERIRSAQGVSCLILAYCNAVPTTDGRAWKIQAAL